jgi:hypothetical protein
VKPMTKSLLPQIEAAEQKAMYENTWTETDHLVLGRGDKGRARAIVQEFKGDIITIDEKLGSSYVWSEDTALYEEHQLDKTLMRISDRLEDLANDAIKRQPPEDYIGPKPEQEILKMNNYDPLKKALKLALPHLTDPSLLEKLDRTAYLIPCPPRKVVDLRTGTVRDRTREDMFTCEFPYEYVSQPSYPIIRSLFLSFANQDEEMADFYSADFGYSYTGETTERKFCQDIGEGRNAKTTAFELVGKSMGPFYGELPTGCIIDTGGSGAGQADPHLFVLQRIRLGMFDEIKEGEMIDARMLKRLADGGVFKARTL